MNNLLQTLESHKLYNGRMIGWSKSEYRRQHPDNEVVFNANLVSRDGKQWYGDINLTLDSKTLQKVSNESGQMFLILREMDCRFDTENALFEELEKKAVKIFTPEKQWLASYTIALSLLTMATIAATVVAGILIGKPKVSSLAKKLTKLIQKLTQPTWQREKTSLELINRQTYDP